MAYSRGGAFSRKNWFALFAVPAFLFLLFYFSYSNLQNSFSPSFGLSLVNKISMLFGFGYRLGESASIGIDLVGVAAWMMFLTVGWHYSKQVFGCAMVYANYDAYPISMLQRRVIKFCVFGVAFYSFCYLSFHWRALSSYRGAYNLLGVPITELAPPLILEKLATWIVVLGIPCFLYFVVYTNFKRYQLLPSFNFLVPLLAFYIWWIPLFPQAEFYLMLVPFFHSIQYLAFAYRVEKFELGKMNYSLMRFSLRTILLLFCGFLVFELLPGLLDAKLGPDLGIGIFFTLAAMVFINIHHFFLDSVLWRFQDASMRNSILSQTDERRKNAIARFG
jgi:hypothetical protein